MMRTPTAFLLYRQADRHRPRQPTRMLRHPFELWNCASTRAGPSPGVAQLKHAEAGRHQLPVMARRDGERPSAAGAPGDTDGVASGLGKHSDHLQESGQAPEKSNFVGLDSMLIDRPGSQLIIPQCSAWAVSRRGASAT